MCGRFVLFTTSDPLLHAAADIAPYGELLAPHGTPSERYNIAPTQKIAIVRPGQTTGTGAVSYTHLTLPTSDLV